MQFRLFCVGLHEAFSLPEETQDTESNEDYSS